MDHQDTHDVTHEANRSGRADLEQWAATSPQNFYTSDPHFVSIVEQRSVEARRGALVEELTAFGAACAQHVDGLARENNLHRNLPELDRYSPYGARTERVSHHPTYHSAGEYIYGAGAIAALAEEANLFGALTRFYVSSHNGEAGHNCPLACTAGVVRVLQELGDDALKERFLGRLLDRDYARHYEGAQFLTEVQGGSDVGANATRAVLAEDGTWRIHGEKWFCSNVDADVYLMTARLPDAPEGTRGLGLFLVPRELEVGGVNAFHVRRLKDKLGTRSMASGECDFRGARAYHMGEVGEGFKHMMELVINTSRLYNAVGCAGLARRAYVDARRYAAHRRAFGRPVLEFPLVQETLSNVRVDVELMTSGTFYLVQTQDRMDAGEGTDADVGFMRLAINLNKSFTAKRARWAITEGIEVLGGNGAIESFSVLPRLLRDSIVFENWEGTHNTLLSQCLRDMHRYGVHDAYLARCEELIEGTAREAELTTALSRCRARIDGVLSAPQASASLALRPLADTLCATMYASVRARELETFGLGDEARREAELALDHFISRHVLPEEPTYDATYLERIATLSS